MYSTPGAECRHDAVGARRGEDVRERSVEQAQVGGCPNGDPPRRSAGCRELTEEEGECPMRRDCLRRHE
jgi:hypothetical protein